MWTLQRSGNVNFLFFRSLNVVHCSLMHLFVQCLFTFRTVCSSVFVLCSSNKDPPDRGTHRTIYNPYLIMSRPHNPIITYNILLRWTCLKHTTHNRTRLWNQDSIGKFWIMVRRPKWSQTAVRYRTPHPLTWRVGRARPRRPMPLGMCLEWAYHLLCKLLHGG